METVKTYQIRLDTLDNGTPVHLYWNINNTCPGGYGWVSTGRALNFLTREAADEALVEACKASWDRAGITVVLIEVSRDKVSGVVVRRRIVASKGEGDVLRLIVDQEGQR